MERIKSINPNRISWCCADHGISTEQLAVICGIAPASMNRVMLGEDGITFNQLRNLAEYFGRGVMFFLEDTPVVDEQVHTPQFRSLANQKPELSAKLKTLIERVERQREIYLSLREDLDAADIPQFTPPDLSGVAIRDAAQVARDWLGLGNKNSFDTYREAIENRGILVFRSNGYSGKWQIAKESPILGFSLYNPICPVIVIKKLDWEPRQSFTLIHELGHLLLHKISSIDDENDLQSHQGQEREANAFAGSLLVPDAFLAEVRDDLRPDEVSLLDAWLDGPRKSWGVSGEVILRRLMDVGRLDPRQYEAYRNWKNQNAPIQDSGGNRQFRNREPIHIFGDNFVRTVLDSLYARRITLTKASSYLDSLKVKDLHQLGRYYAKL